MGNSATTWSLSFYKPDASVLKALLKPNQPTIKPDAVTDTQPTVSKH